MAKQDGAKIKEARAAAGLSQKALAEKAGCVTATDISKAERDLKELTPEQLEAVAQALGVTPESLTDAPQVLSDEELELLKLYKSADPDTQNAAAALLKGEKAQDSNPMAAMMSMFGGMMGGGDAGGEGGENPMAAMMGGGDAGGEGGENPMAGMMSMFSGMMGGGNAEGGENAGGDNPMAGMMSMFGGMMGGGEKKEAPEEDKKEEK